MKKWIISNCVFIIATIVLCFILKDNPDGGFKDVKTVEDYQNLMSQTEITANDQNNPKYAEGKLKRKETTFKELKGENDNSYKKDINVFVVEVENEFTLGDKINKQKVKVTDVIDGDEGLLNQSIYIVSTSFIIYNEDLGYNISYWGNNIMQPNNRYLVFCEKVEISDYLDTPHYRTIYSQFSYLNLDNTKEYYTFPNKYENLKNCEFFVNNKDSADTLFSIKQEIIDTYLKNHSSQKSE